MDIREVKVNAAGEVTDVMINGNTYSMEKAVEFAKSGKIKGAKIEARHNGEQYISHLGDMELTQLPRFV
ncbi:hypothetical protein JCM14036_33600 [Desulfotomaculum defluvii]